MVEIRPLIYHFHYFKGHHLVLVVTLDSFLVCIPTGWNEKKNKSEKTVVI